MDNNAQFDKNELGIKCNSCGEKIDLLLGAGIMEEWQLAHKCRVEAECVIKKKPFIRNKFGTRCRYCGEGIGEFTTPEKVVQWMENHKC